MYSLIHPVVFWLCFLALVVPSVRADVYKWEDDKGVVHYSDTPRQSSRQLQLDDDEAEGSSTSMSAEQRQERRQRLLQAMEEDRLEREKQKAEKAKQQAEMNRRCVVAKDRLRNYRRAGRLYRLDKDGNRISLSDEERERATRNLQAEIDKHCR